jgi:GTP-binding protein HflX
LFFDRPASGELAVLVHLDFAHDKEREDPREFEELVLSAGGDPVDFIAGQRSAPDPRYFVGTGKLDEIRGAVQAYRAELVIFNHTLSPSQERNLEKELSCRVLDRTGLILDIFAQRARSHVGKLQVELAQLQHMATRLVRGWTHLERQKGGIGLRGPGETQLETDRRLLRARIKSLTRRLEKVHKQREQGRRSRRRADIPTVSLVGYTNAGKSTLFNAVTQADVYVADQLFATLDPTMRRKDLPDLGAVILADTVGFIRHLPHKLVEAFQATLEEAAEADLLLHVIDANEEDKHDTVIEVQEVLEEIGAGEIRQLEVHNKIDLLEGVKPRIDRDEQSRPVKVWLSAANGSGLDLLEQAIAELLGEEVVHEVLCLAPENGRLRARLYKQGAVIREAVSDQGTMRLEIRMPKSDLSRLLANEHLELSALRKPDEGRHSSEVVL